MRQIKNNKKLMFNKCDNPKINNEKSTINFCYEGKNRSITGQSKQLEFLLKRLNNEISELDFENAINSSS